MGKYSSRTQPIIDVKQISELNEIAKEYKLSEIQTQAFVNFMVRYDPSGNIEYAREQANRIFNYPEYKYDKEWQELLEKCFRIFGAKRELIVTSNPESESEQE